MFDARTSTESVPRLITEVVFQEYGPDNGSGDIKEEVFQEYSLFQARFKESSGVETPMKKRIAIFKKGEKCLSGRK